MASTPQPGAAGPDPPAGSTLERYTNTDTPPMGRPTCSPSPCSASPPPRTPLAAPPRRPHLEHHRRRNTQDYLTDALGSVVATANAAAGTIAQTYTCDPIGNLSSANPGDTNPYRYAGQYQDQTTGTYAIGARTLNTTFGAWTQPDLSGQDANQYDYGGNDPINNSDPSGQFSLFNALDAVVKVDNVARIIEKSVRETMMKRGELASTFPGYAVGGLYEAGLIAATPETVGEDLAASGFGVGAGSAAAAFVDSKEE